MSINIASGSYQHDLTKFLNFLLFKLEHSERIPFDMFRYEKNHERGKDIYNTSLAGINYKKEELESFTQKFK